MNIAVHITAYLDSSAVGRVLQSIQSQSHQPDVVFLVDNSPQALCVSRCLLALDDSHEPANLGTAGAINASLIALRSRGMDYLWLLDQDSEPGPELLERLIASHQSIATVCRFPVGIVAPLTRNRDDAQPNVPLCFDRYRSRAVPYGSEPVECDFLPAAGMLLHLPSLTRLQLPSDRYFLDVYDFALGLAVRKARAGVWMVPTLELSHQVSRKFLTQTRSGPRLITDMPAARCSLLHRNTTYLFIRTARGHNRILAAAWQLRRALFHASKLIRSDLNGRFYKAASVIHGWCLGLFCLRPENKNR